MTHIASVLDFENNFLNILNGIRLPSAAESSLFVMCALLWLVVDSNLVNIMHFMASKWKYSIFTKSKLTSYWFCFISVAHHFTWLHGPSGHLGGLLSICCLHINLYTALKWFDFGHSQQVLWFVPQYLQFSTLFYFLWASLSFLVCWLTSQILWAILLFNATFCAICTSTCWAYSITLSLEVSSISSNVDTSLMLLICNSFLDCSVINLLYSLCSHSAAFLHSLPIHFWTDSLHFLCNFQYWSDVTILLCHSWNSLLSIEKKDLLLICIFIFLYGWMCLEAVGSLYLTFSSLVRSYAFISRM